MYDTRLWKLYWEITPELKYLDQWEVMRSEGSERNYQAPDKQQAYSVEIQDFHKELFSKVWTGCKTAGKSYVLLSDQLEL